MAYDIIVGRTVSDKKKFGDRGTIFLGRHYVKMGQTVSLSSNIRMDVARAHVVLVSGKRGSGKCLHGDTLIQIEDGSQVPIRDLANVNKRVLGLGNNLKIKSLEKNDFFERKVDKILHLKLRSGKEIKLTPEHPLLTVRGWVPAGELNLGGRIATPRKLDAFGNCDMDDYEIKILAYLIAEGHTMKSWVLFSNKDGTILDDFKDSIQKFDNNLKIGEHSKPGCYRVANPDNRYGFKKNPIKEWLKSKGCYGYYAKDKWLPEEILKLKKDKLKLFLNRLFSCDGSIYKNESRNGWEIDYCSSSKRLINQVNNLLLRFGIISKLRKKKIKLNGKSFESYELILNPENTIKFIEEIGFFGEKKKKQELCMKEIVKVIRNPNVDTIPKELWDIYRPSNWVAVGRHLGHKHPKAMRERIRYSPSRQMLLQIAESDNNEQMSMLAQSDIFWDEIIEMKILEGKFKVYDISVPDFHNFVANDIIVHNSYTLGVMAEEMSNLPKEVSQNLGILIFDTMGIFWTMKYPNQKEEDLLGGWQLTPKKLGTIDIHTPHGFSQEYKRKKIPVDFPFSIKTSELDAGDWVNVFNVDLMDSIGILVEKVVSELQDSKKEYDVNDIIRLIKKDKSVSNEVRDATINRFEATKSWGLFSKRGTEIRDLIKPGRVSILDISCYSNIAGSWGIKNLVTGLICKKLLFERMTARKIEEIRTIEAGESYFGLGTRKRKKGDMPLVWLMLDEAHEFLPREGTTAASNALIQLLREGRQPGISLVLATQQPGEIHKDVITQSDIVISHRVTARKDITALNDMMQTYLLSDIQTYINNLPRMKGSAIVLDDNSERIFPMNVRPRFTWHGGEAPSAVIAKREELEELGLEL